MNFGEAMRVAREEKDMIEPSAIGAQPPPEYLDEEWLMMQEDEEGDEPFCNCSAGHSIEETDWNQCDSCGKPIYDEEPAVTPAPTFEDQAKDAERYRLLRRGQHWSVINGIGDTLRADQLDAAIDAELAAHNAVVNGAGTASG